jgi:UDP-glucose 4-epimerase
MIILLTGAAGFIGSHTTLELLNCGFTVIGIDNCCNAYHDKSEQLPESLKRVKDITGKKIVYYNVDIRDKKALDVVFKQVMNFFFIKYC